MFVRFECGCIGFPPDGAGKALIVQRCYGDEPLTWSQEDFEGKTFTPAPADREAKLHRVLGQCIGSFYTLKDFVAAFKAADRLIGRHDAWEKTHPSA